MQAPDGEAEEARLGHKITASSSLIHGQLVCNEVLLPPGQGNQVTGMLSAAAGSVSRKPLNSAAISESPFCDEAPLLWQLCGKVHDDPHPAEYRVRRVVGVGRAHVRAAGCCPPLLDGSWGGDAVRLNVPQKVPDVGQVSTRGVSAGQCPGVTQCRGARGNDALVSDRAGQ